MRSEFVNKTIVRTKQLYTVANVIELYVQLRSEAESHRLINRYRNGSVRMLPHEIH